MVLDHFQETAKEEVDKIVVTDAPLLFPPGQVLLAFSFSYSSTFTWFMSKFLGPATCFQFLDNFPLGLYTLYEEYRFVQIKRS